MKINGIMYADDTVLLAPKIKDLEKMLRIVENYCYKWQIKLNIEKSNYMIFGNYYQRRENKKISVNGYELKRTSEIKYLGIKINEIFSDKLHINEKRQKMTKCIFMLYSLGINTNSMSNEMKCHMLKTYCRPVLYYGIENMTIMKSDLEKIHSSEGSLVKKVLGVSKYSHHTNLMYAYGYEPSEIAITKRKLQFYNQLLGNEHTAQIIEERWKNVNNPMFSRSLVQEVKNIVSEGENSDDDINIWTIGEKIKKKLENIKNKIINIKSGGICETIRYLFAIRNKDMLNMLINPLMTIN